MKKLMFFFLVVLILPLFFGCSKQQSAAQSPTGTDRTANRLLKEPLTFRVAFAENPDTNVVVFLSAAYKKASELTNGEILFEIFPSGQLGSIPDFIEQMRAGAPIICNAGIDNLAEMVPEFLPAAVPYAYLDITEILKLVKTPWMANIKQLMIDKVNLYPVGIGASGYRHFLSRKPIYDASSIAGMKVRMGPSAMAQGYIKVMGGAPIANNWADNYPSLQQGVFDACEASLSLLYTSSLYEVTKYLTLSGHFITPAVQTTSSEAWAKIPAPYQKIIEDCVAEGFIALLDDVQKTEQPLIQQFKDKGIEVIETDKLTFAAYTPKLLESLGYKADAYTEFRKAIESVK
jgi:TRAP-type C4-dicarboxylate transport system substrate-binding protein